MKKLSKNELGKGRLKVMKEIRKMTGFDRYNKKEGSIVNKIKYKGRIVTGEEMNKVIMNHYREANNGRSSNIWKPFPLKEISAYTAFNASQVIKTKKAGALDGISGRMF